MDTETARLRVSRIATPATIAAKPTIRIRSGRSPKIVMPIRAVASGIEPPRRMPTEEAGTEWIAKAETWKKTAPEPATIKARSRIGSLRGKSPVLSQSGASRSAGTP
ncbi:hypothetical protein D9M70_652700 [compost metagenome]